MLFFVSSATSQSDLFIMKPLYIFTVEPWTRSYETGFIFVALVSKALSFTERCWIRVFASGFWATLGLYLWICALQIKRKPWLSFANWSCGFYFLADGLLCLNHSIRLYLYAPVNPPVSQHLQTLQLSCAHRFSHTHHTHWLCKGEWTS